MHQCNVGDLSERIAVDIAGAFLRRDQGNRYLIGLDYYMKWPEAYDIPDQEASTVADALITNFFCGFGIPQELRSDQDCNSESHLAAGVTMPGSEQDMHHGPAPTV
jgi:hypothetical protein